MKRWFFIFGIVIILVLIGIWVFLLFASNETKQEIYNRFGFTGSTEEGIIDTIVDAILPDLEEELPPLRQLTTKRVAGFAEISIASSSPQVYFSEAGTGHVYSISLQNGVEAKISNTTLAGTRIAEISKNGTYAALRAGNEESGPVTIVTLGTTSESIIINEPVLDFTITDDDQFLYSIASADGVVGRTYDIESRNARTLFTVPFRQATILWGNHSESQHYVLPKTARSLEGYLYTVSSDGFDRTPLSGYGLSVLPSENYTLYSESKDDSYRSYIQNNEANTSMELTSVFFPPKCTVSSQNIAFCGQDAEANTSFFPDNWYRGEVSFADELWSLNLATLETTFLLSTLDVTAREIDIIDMTLSADELDLYFINKNDYTLWVYDVVSQ